MDHVVSSVINPLTWVSARANKGDKQIATMNSKINMGENDPLRGLTIAFMATSLIWQVIIQRLLFRSLILEQCRLNKSERAQQEKGLSIVARIV